MRHRGFTIVEVLITAAILAVCLIGLWKLFLSGARATAVGTWYSAANIELRNGLRRLRDDINHATYPSEITNAGVTVDTGVAYQLGTRTGETRLTPGARPRLLEFAICKPRRDVAGEPGQEGVRIKATLEGRDRTLWYTKTAEAGSVPDAELHDGPLVRDVDTVWIEVQASGEPEKSTIIVRVKCVHPAFAQSAVEQETMAKVEVATRTL